MIKDSSLSDTQSAKDDFVEKIQAKVLPFHPDMCRDNSPKIDGAILADTLESVSALSLGDLAYQLTLAADQLPLFDTETLPPVDRRTREAVLMAACFETGRRYMLIQACELLAEEVELLPRELANTEPKPILEH